MSRKRCRRKVWALVNPIEHAISGAAITAKRDLDQLRMRELTALDCFTHGRATVDDWRALADMLNIAETLARDGVGPEVLEACARAEHALDEAHRRHKELGKLGFDGPGMQAMRDLAEYHDLQRTSIGRSDYERAIKKTADRIRSAPADVKVLIS